MPKLLEHTGRVTFELSNTCNFSHAHTRCPAHEARGAPVFLPERIVYDILDFMAEDGFDGYEVAYHNYSEPTIDPRLMLFLDAAKARMPNIRQYILSNGLTMCQQLYDELVAHGATRIWFTAYDDATRDRLRALKKRSADLHIDRKCKLDLRMDMYDRKIQDLKLPCHEPLESLLIRATGQVGLCCMDWRNSYPFGNLHDMSLRHVLESGEMHKVWNRLRKGGRSVLPICRRCKSQRGTNL